MGPTHCKPHLKNFFSDSKCRLWCINNFQLICGNFVGFVTGKDSLKTLQEILYEDGSI